MGWRFRSLDSSQASSPTRRGFATPFLGNATGLPAARPAKELELDPKTFIGQVEEAWTSRARTPDGKALTRLHVHIAAKLAFWRSPVCRQRSLARAAGCSIRTVQRALARLYALSLLSWTRRVLATRAWRAQVANAYSLGSKERVSYQCIRSSANLSPPGTGRPLIQPQGDLLEAARMRMQARFLAARRC
jgi:AraC-like DNA-binding protein